VITPADAATELLARRAARGSFTDYCRYRLPEDMTLATHHELLTEALVTPGRIGAAAGSAVAGFLIDGVGRAGAYAAAAGFAIVGNFEDAVYCWRAAASSSGIDAQRRILLMTGGGALGLRLADPRIEADVRGEPLAPDADPSLTSGPASGFDWSGTEPDPAGLRSAVGLVWRSVVLWNLLFAKLTIANWLGR
jgi:adenosylcobinamide-phosphate synthase